MSNGVIDKNVKLPHILNNDYEVLKNNDIVLADASEDYVEIAKPVVLYDICDRKIVAGLHTIGIRPADNNSLFLYYVFNTGSFRKYAYKTGTGLKVFGISSKNVLNYSVTLPKQKEQVQIGKILHIVERVIAANVR